MNLMHELRVSSDYLASALMDSGHPLQHKFFLQDAETESEAGMPYTGRGGSKDGSGEGAQGGVRGGGGGHRARSGKSGARMDAPKTRILPVYVLSLQRPGRPPLIDGISLHAATRDAVVVLQHGDEVSLPFFAGTSQLTVRAANPSASILAGILTALGAVAAPTLHYSQHHKKTMSELVFAHGWSPFGPFGRSLELSQILVDQCVRNAVVWRIDAAVSPLIYNIKHTNIYIIYMCVCVYMKTRIDCA
jgi:hypothetical protein